jgi:hypothetical protein
MGEPATTAAQGQPGPQQDGAQTNSTPVGPDWAGMGTLSRVQELLDQNRLLITEINHNHELRTPDALQRNTILLRQLNANISDVAQQYQDLATLVVDASAVVVTGGSQ